ncbi:MAG TPA: HAD hydrolase family protein [Rhodospirillaceae bacterium]|jgi:3-deoxy-D-manno-octulosonate 8-phosphate phosphatase (KDO 8-P phosphatase)|nr:HAD hydrolase family protein [Rhodospirillales bacterium]HIJ43625.1 HAD hydrolase family protein [Rhodospirillaceae bacterium]HIJ46147.1 HAD hydrolase family protein [Rhodospirillaceae bacterium]HIJ93589.1 HAD hydrolase family protein [Rhodospirillaceae bacterium]
MGAPSRTKLSAADLLRRLATVKLLSLDVDGVLTDGGLYFADDGSQLRRFNVKDGEGIKRLLKAAVEVVVISASQAEAILKRGESLGLEHVRIGVEDKLAVLSALCSELAIELAEVAHMGDDFNDLPVLEAVGLPLSVADAMPEVRERALYVTERGGGEGAVREICDLLLAARK